MASTIQIKRGTGSAVPSGLLDGELALNLDNGKLYYGSGSAVVNSFRFTNLTAENYIVSSSVTNITTQELSGSTVFGNSSDDTHTFTGAITASGEISASGTIYAGDQGFYINNKSGLHESAGVANIFGDNNVTNITLGRAPIQPNISIQGPVTASGNISASGNVLGDFIVSNGIMIGRNNGTTTLLAADTTPTEIQGTNINLDAPVTASSNISASGLIYGNEVFVRDARVRFNNNVLESANKGIHSQGSITASGDISSSGTITGNNGVFSGDLDVAGEIECDHLNIDDIDDGIHFGNTQVLHIDASNNVNFGVPSNSAVDLELYGYNHTLTAGNLITLDAESAIVLDSEIGNIHFKDTGTTQLSFDMDGTAGAQVIQLKVSGDDLIFKNQGGNSLLTLKHEGQTEIHGNITSSGNISSSASIIANELVSDSIVSEGGVARATIINNLGAVAQEGNDPSIRLTNSYDVSIGDADEAGDGTRIEVKESNQSITLFGNVTSSGNISASNSITAATASIDVLTGTGGATGLEVTGFVSASSQVLSTTGSFGVLNASNVRSFVELKGDDLYLVSPSSQNRWYGLASNGQSIVNASTVNGVSTSDSSAIRMTSFVTPRNCTVHTITTCFYGIANDADLEFEVVKVPLVDDSTSNVTLSTMTTSSSHNGTFTANKNYVKTFTITGNNTLTAGQGLAFVIRKTSSDSVNLYGQATAEIEITY